LRDRYAALELWRGSMTSHSLIVHRNDDANEIDRAPSFDDDRWRRYVPLRLATTVCVQERLPAGAAAVLLNRSHQFHDLILAVDTQEKQMCDAIDGRRTIAEIVEYARGGNVWSRARALFERLWWYDQVVFDASMIRE
jgi:hypothetical protein